MKWMNSTNLIKKIDDYITLFFTILGVIALVIGIINSCVRKRDLTPSPVKECRIDSITKINDKLIIEVEHLDSIKDAKIIEVKSLDNDSTLRLFYQLIGK